MRVNETVTAFDVADALKNDQGTFLVQRLGQTSCVTAEAGHSITSWRSIGTAEPVIPVENAGYRITKISNQVLREPGQPLAGSDLSQYSGSRS